MNWAVETYGPVVDAEIAALPVDMRERLFRFLDIVRIAGPVELPPKAVKHLEGKLWELRIKGRDGIARAIYITITGRRVIILRAFVKKTQKTPQLDLDLARRRSANIARPAGRN